MLLEIFQEGIGKGIFRIEKPEETASLFLEVIHGLRLIVIQDRPINELKAEDYNLIYEKQQNFIKIFIRSIKY